MKGIRKALTFLAGSAYASLWWIIFRVHLSPSINYVMSISLVLSTIALIATILLFMMKNWDIND